MNFNIVRIWKIDWCKRRTFTGDELDSAFYQEFGPPWMETGYIRTCFLCDYEVWEYVSLPDGCLKCKNKDTETRYPNWLEKLVHWYRVDNRFTPTHSIKKGLQDAQIKPPPVDLPPLPEEDDER